MKRKICAIGNSRGVSIPVDVLEELDLSVGSAVEIKLDEKHARIVIEPIRKKKKHPAGVDREFVDPWANEQVLRRLAGSSQGALLATEDLASLPGLIMAHTSSPALMTRELWHGPWTFLLLLGVLTAEWVTRRMWGMR